MESAKGSAMHAAESENTKVLLTAFAYATRSICKTCGDLVNDSRFDAPALITAWAEMDGVRLGISFSNALTKML